MDYSEEGLDFELFGFMCRYNEAAACYQLGKNDVGDKLLDEAKREKDAAAKKGGSEASELKNDFSKVDAAIAAEYQITMLFGLPPDVVFETPGASSVSTRCVVNYTHWRERKRMCRRRDRKRQQK